MALLIQPKKPVNVTFVDDKLKQEFESLQKGTSEEKELYFLINRAILDLKENPLRYIHIPKKSWPKEYIHKHSINNLWKYDLPNGWRLIYTIHHEELTILALVLEWFSHKEYERRFGY